MAILNNLIVKGDTRFIGEAGGNFTGTFNGFDLQMAAPANTSDEGGSEGLISSTDKRDLDKLIARVAGFATTAGAIDSNSRCAAYTATISGIGTTLTAGTVIYIKIHAKSAANATLDVNNIGAKSIYWRTSAITNDKLGLNYIFMLVYDGTNWVIPYDYDTTYSAASVGFGYGTCSTAKDTAAKTVSINNYSLNSGGIVAIKFTNGSNAANPTLNINSRGAKNIYYNGAAITLTNDYFIAGLTYLFVFDGTQYQLIGVNYETDYGICSTAAGTAAKTVNVDLPFVKVAGAHVTVKFTITNTASSPTLNVNNTGAAAIYYRGAAISAGYLAANRTYEFVFNGTQYELIGDINTNVIAATATPSEVSTAAGVVGTSTKYAREDHKHKLADITRTDPTKSTQTLTYGGTFDAVNSVTTNSAGQVTAVATRTFTLPSVSQSVANGDTKPVSGEAVYEYINATLKGKANGLASLDSSGKVPSSQLPSYVDDVIEGYISSDIFYDRTKTAPHSGSTIYICSNIVIPTENGGGTATNYQWNSSSNAFVSTTSSGQVAGYAYFENIAVGAPDEIYLAADTETSKIYVDLATNKTYRWSGTTYVEISESIALGETSSTAYAGDKGKEVTDTVNLLKTASNSSRKVYLSSSGDDNNTGFLKSAPMRTFAEVIRKYGYLSHITIYIDIGPGNNYSADHFYIYNWQTINIIGANFSNNDPELLSQQVAEVGTLTAQIHINSCGKVLFQNIKFAKPNNLDENNEEGLYNESTIDNKTYLVYANYTKNVVFNGCYFTGISSIGAIYTSDSKVRVHNCTFNTFANVYGIYNNSELNSYANTASGITRYAEVANSRYNSLSQDFGSADQSGNTYNGNSLVHPNNVIQPISGGTGKTNLKDSSNALINALDAASSIPADNDYYVSQYANGGTSTTTYHRRPMSKLWEYILSKLGSRGAASFGQGYATCSTAEATAAKTVSITNYTLSTGGIVSIKFTNAVPANATLNITSKGAKNIYHDGAAITANIIKAGDIATFIYDGTQYQLIAINFVNVSRSNTTSTASPAHGATFTAIDSITTNNRGQVTAVNTKTVTLPADNNTDTKVTADPKNDAKGYIIINKGSTNSSTDSVRFNTGVYVEDSNSNLHVEGTVNSAIPYGTCSTAAGTAEKAVTVPGTFSLITGARVIVKFTVTNTASSPTLNVNSKGAKAIYYRGSAITAGNLVANRTYTFIYNGTQFELVGDINTDSDTKVTNTVNTTTKAYVTGTTSASTNTGTQIFDTDVYIGATAGEFNSKTYKLNEAVTFAYNSTNQCVDFIFE